MSDSALDNATMYGGLQPPDWQAAAPTIGISSMAFIVLVAPLLLVAGVVWLRQLPSAIDPGNSGDVIKIHLLGPRTDNTQGQDVAEAAKAEPTQAADPLIDDDQNHAIPRDALAPMPPERLRPTPAAVSSIPAPSAMRRTACSIKRL
jgi:hypothetical protein